MKSDQPGKIDPPEDGPITMEALRQQTWSFFQVQAGQRMTTFNFFIVISTFLAAGLVASFTKDVKNPAVGMITGFALVIFAIIFWLLDRRNIFLIEGAEDSLIFFEDQLDLKDDKEGFPHKAKRFKRERELTKKKWRSPINWTYTPCFNIVFFIFGLMGFAGFIYSIILATR